MSVLGTEWDCVALGGQEEHAGPMKRVGYFGIVVSNIIIIGHVQNVDMRASPEQIS